MMIIVKTDTPALDPAAIRRLAAHMLNLEHGARAFGPGLIALPAPHAPWPLIEMPARTREGLPTQVHYRPSVGIVYYSGLDFQVAGLIAKVEALIAPVVSHLMEARATAASFTGMARARATRAETVCVGQMSCHPFVLPTLPDSLPARVIQYTPPRKLRPPYHFSTLAGFTWVFMPIAAALQIGQFKSMQDVNAIVASVFFDAGNLCRLRDGDEVELLRLSDMIIEPLPIKPRFGPHAALLLEPGGAIRLLGDYRVLQKERMMRYTALPLAEVPLAVERGAVCTYCAAPLGGDIVVVSGFRMPGLGWLLTPMGWSARSGDQYAGPAQGTGLVGEKPAPFCPRCWEFFADEIAEAGRRASDPNLCAAVRATLPWGQAAATPCPDMAALLRCRWSALATPGAFRAEAGELELILAAKKTGYPVHLLASHLPILADLPIVLCDG